MKQFQFPYQQEELSNLKDEIKKLVKTAQLEAQKAYAPYSHFKVGAAVLLNDGRILTGANHENASYPAGVCAERAALSALDMNNVNHYVKAIAVTYLDGADTSKPLSPCGICRQTILEVQQWQNKPIEVYMCSPQGHVITLSDASYLMPFSFGSDYLNTEPQSILD